MSSDRSAGHPMGEPRMNPVVAVIAPGMMGAAVGKRLADHGLKVLTSLKGRSAETTARAKTAGMAVRQRRGDRSNRFHPVDPAPRRRGRARAAVRARAHRQQQQAGLRRLQRGEPADGRAHRRRRHADRLALRRRRHHRRPTQARRCRSALLRLRPARAALRQAQGLRPRRARARGPHDRGLGDENVLCRHHQGHAGAGRGR